MTYQEAKYRACELWRIQLGMHLGRAEQREFTLVMSTATRDMIIDYVRTISPDHGRNSGPGSSIGDMMFCGFVVTVDDRVGEEMTLRRVAWTRRPDDDENL
jgi:hypothetical protein